jgi:LAO/AO transport system kinase
MFLNFSFNFAGSMKQNINQNIRLERPPKRPVDFKTLLAGVNSGELLSISRAITLVENKNLSNTKEVLEFLSALKKTKRSLRLAISGPPGVGKSTFIETLGLHLINMGKKIAVLAIDPSSEINRGSILGDKTRMPKLSRQENAFIRPSSNALENGGVRSSTYDAIKICEAAGFDIIIVETVGVGQSELDATKITDLLILLLAPAGGDELQGIKKGIVELADMILINKADSGLEKLAEKAKKDYQSALHFYSPKKDLFEQLYIQTISSLKDSGIAEVAGKLIELIKDKEVYQKILSNRLLQDGVWFNKKAEQLLLMMILNDPKFKQAAENISDKTDIHKALLELSEAYSKII